MKAQRRPQASHPESFASEKTRIGVAPLGRILWAADPFTEVPGLHEKCARAIRLIRSVTQSKVQPVYALIPKQMNLPEEYQPVLMDSYRPAAEKKLKAAVAALDDFGEPKVLGQTAVSAHQAVENVISYAKGQGAGMIVTGTHARKGMKRLLLGSFTETLLLRSEIPVLVVNPRVQVPKARFRKILVATDLGIEAKSFVFRAVEFAQQLEVPAVLFHVLPSSVEPLLQSGAFLLGGGWVPMHTSLSENDMRRRRRLEAWARWARTREIDCEAYLHADVGTQGSIAQSILDTAREVDADLIAMQPHKGSLSSMLIGSITRQVAREAHCPVWVARA